MGSTGQEISDIEHKKTFRLTAAQLLEIKKARAAKVAEKKVQIREGNDAAKMLANVKSAAAAEDCPAAGGPVGVPNATGAGGAKRQLQPAAEHVTVQLGSRYGSRQNSLNPEAAAEMACVFGRGDVAGSSIGSRAGSRQNSLNPEEARIAANAPFTWDAIANAAANVSFPLVANPGATAIKKTCNDRLSVLSTISDREVGRESTFSVANLGARERVAAAGCAVTPTASRDPHASTLLDRDSSFNDPFRDSVSVHTLNNRSSTCTVVWGGISNATRSSTATNVGEPVPGGRDGGGGVVTIAEAPEDAFSGTRTRGTSGEREQLASRASGRSDRHSSHRPSGRSDDGRLSNRSDASSRRVSWQNSIIDRVRGSGRKSTADDGRHKSTDEAGPTGWRLVSGCLRKATVYCRVKHHWMDRTRAPRVEEKRFHQGRTA